MDQLNQLLLSNILMQTIPVSDLVEADCLPPCIVHEFTAEPQPLNAMAFPLPGIDYKFFIQYQVSDDVIRVKKDQYVYDINNLIGEIGGSLGLFLGASLVSLWENILQRMINACQLK